MDNNSIIDRKTFEVYKHSEDYPNAFIVDKPLAEVISILNKKGYKTLASCAGHSRITFDEFRNVDLKELEEAKKDDKIIIRKVRNDNFDYWREAEYTYMYILFDREYSLGELPKPFYYYIDEGIDRTDIECKIEFYDKNGERKSQIDIMNEIDKNSEILKAWAENLPNRKKGNDIK